ncbi:MAG TPA: trigger factor [Bacteroidia bacterium]|jgi:trigger factor|nr:trigger factor [Bacteroidia bacterium]
MDIVKESIDETNAVIKVKVIPADYKKAVDKSIKDYQKKAVIPGFRPGLVPTSVITKRFGKSILADEVNHILSHSLDNYIKENKLRIVGEPLPQSSNVELEFEKEFEFAFEVGLVPDFDVPLSTTQKFTLFQVNIDEKFVDEYIEEMRLRFGNLTHPDVSGESDILIGDFVELDANGEILPGGIFKSSAINLGKFPAGKSKEKFLGRQEGDKLTLKLDEVTKDYEEVAAMMSIPKEQAANLTSSFQVTLKHVHRIIPAEINQEWWDKIYGPGKVNNSEDFRAKVKQELVSVFGPQAERKLQNEMVEYLIGNTTIKMPETFLKKWLHRVSKEPISDEQMNIEFEVYAQSLKWRLIEDKIFKDNNMTVTQQEVMDYTHALVHGYLGQGANEEQVKATVQRVLSDEKEVNRIYERLYDMKLVDLLKKTYTIENKELPREEFEKIMENVK